MYKKYFHNKKSFHENKVRKNITQVSSPNKKNIVDINILLNRVKIEERNETKRKIIFFSFVTFALCIFGTFISIIK